MNSSRSLLVLGVTGQVGTLVAQHLKRSEVHFSVGTRRKANLEELAHQFGASRFIDLDDPRTFDEALKGVTGIFLVTGYTVDMLVQSKTLIDAAKRNDVNHIVHLGAFTRDHDDYSTVFAWHQMIEAYLRDSGAGWTNLHPNMFMQNLLGWQVKGGLYSVYTSKPIGFTALEDVSEAAAVILMEGPDKHSGKDYWFSADVLDPQQVAETLTAATGHKFTAAVRDHERFLEEMALPPGSRFEPAYAKGGIELFREVEHGRMAYIGSVADDTKKVLGREPLLLRDWAKLHAHELLEAAGS
jgi:NAD(P)H dehydrogenase (quinone)